MQIFVDYWYIFVGLLAVLVFVVLQVKNFIGLPTDKQIANVKEWLKYAVTMAEKELQSGTGQLKLRMVYDMFIEKFPTIAKIVPFEVFSGWVDDALVWLNEQLAKNQNVKNIVDNGGVE